MSNEWETIIGLEIHAELNTKSKLFSVAPNRFGDEPNTNITEVCTGMPGALPVLNKEAVKKAIFHSKNGEEKGVTYRIYIQILFQLNRHEEAILLAQKALDYFNVKFPKKVNIAHLIYQFLKYRINLNSKIEKFNHLPENKNKRVLNIVTEKNC